jgi:hypothetical protein
MAARRRSSFFFIGRLEPAELANFNVQNVFLRDRRGGVVELHGHGVAVWWPSQVREEFPNLLDTANRWFGRIASAYYMMSGVALQPTLVSWVEALDVEAKDAVIGINDARFHKVAVGSEDDANSVLMRDAIDLARKLKDTGELERSTQELLRAANDPSAQAFLSAYRALECVRRVYEPDFDRRKQGWKQMASDLRLGRTPLSRPLSNAAEAIRHGDLPPNRTSQHPVNVATAQRDEILGFALDVVRRAVERHL